jgi:glycosyltransferase 2 family protein
MWIVMLVSPTPGGTGVAELTFLGFLREFVPNGLESALALLWRIITYYPYLFIGAIVLPKWIKRVFADKHKTNR